MRKYLLETPTSPLPKPTLFPCFVHWHIVHQSVFALNLLRLINNNHRSFLHALASYLFDSKNCIRCPSCSTGATAVSLLELSAGRVIVGALFRFYAFRGRSCRWRCTRLFGFGGKPMYNSPDISDKYRVDLYRGILDCGIIRAPCPLIMLRNVGTRS